MSAAPAVGKVEEPRAVGPDHGAKVRAALVVCQAELIFPPCAAARRRCSRCCCAAPAVVLAQGLPAYRPINPVADVPQRRSGSSRSAIPVPGRWQADVGAGVRQHDRVQRELRRRVPSRRRAPPAPRQGCPAISAPRTFLLAEAELLGALRRIPRRLPRLVSRPARHRDPRAGAPAEESLPLRRRPAQRRARSQRRAGDLFLGDLRLGAGFRLHPRLQTVARAHPADLHRTRGLWARGRGRRTCSTRCALPLRRACCSRAAVRLGTRRGTAIPAGAASASSSLSASSGLRWRFWGRQSLYGNLFYTLPTITIPRDRPRPA